VFFRPTGERAFRRLASAVALRPVFRGSRIWPRDPMLRIDAVALATAGFGPAGKLCQSVERPRLSLGTKGRCEHLAIPAMGF
jgi:hypothetical protein